MLDITDGLPVDSDGNLKQMLLSVDNFFNSFHLIDPCSLRNIPIISALRADRLNEVLISSKKEVLKKDREYFKVVHMSNKGKEKAAVVWKDNRAVIMASNCFGSEPIQKAKKWDREEKKEFSVDMPYVVHKYNTSMGGTDRQDQNVNKCRISMRTKKWWWPLFLWGIDVTTQNAWLLFRPSHPRWSLLEFRRYVVRCLLKTNSTARYNQVAAVPKRGIAKELRLSEQQHLVDNDPLKKASCCKVCNLKTQMICTTCKVHLHVKCFATYHTS